MSTRWVTEALPKLWEVLVWGSEIAKTNPGASPNFGDPRDSGVKVTQGNVR